MTVRQRRACFQEESPLGKTIEIDRAAPYIVIGVAQKKDEYQPDDQYPLTSIIAIMGDSESQRRGLHSFRMLVHSVSV